MLPVPRSRINTFLLALALLTSGALARPAPEGGSADFAGPWFEDVTDGAGITWRNLNGAKDQVALVDQNGQGIAVIDFDRDGRPDLFFPNGSTLDRLRRRQPAAPWALFRNRGDGRFTDVTDSAGLRGDSWATGAAVADLDSDGWPDLYVCGVEVTRLYRNQGDGTFVLDPGGAGSEVRGWSSSAAAGDVNGDGFLDLAVACYVRFDPEHQPTTEADGGPCTYRGIPTGCGPWRWSGAGVKLFLGDGASFTEVTSSSGLGAAATARGFQVSLVDLDDDGDLDLYTGCDVMPNVLLSNDGRGHFSPEPSWCGLVSDQGKPESAMGLAIADLDGDSRPEIVTTNFAMEKDTLYRNSSAPGPVRFSDISRTVHLDLHAVELGWGAALADFDLDGYADLLLVNGHIYPQVAALNDDADSYEQPVRLYAGGPGMTFTERRPLEKQVPDGSSVPRWCARALAISDLDGDGALDAVVGVHNGIPRVLLNRIGARRPQSALSLDLVGTLSPRDALGARVVLKRQTGRALVRFSTPHQGFQGTNDFRIVFGLGDPGPEFTQAPHEIEIRWPSGRLSQHRVGGARVTRLVEPDR